MYPHEHCFTDVTSAPKTLIVQPDTPSISTQMIWELYINPTERGDI